VQSDENFFRENNSPVQTYTANIWRAIDMNENIVTRIFLTQNSCNEINANYDIIWDTLGLLQVA
jgi:hypothetical protein